MSMTGEMIIAGQSVRGSGAPLRAYDPSTGSNLLTPVFNAGSVADVDRACCLADQAFDTYRAIPFEKRAAFLERIADGIDELGEELIERAHQESGLMRSRLQGERTRTVGQLRMFAQEVRAGQWLRATVDFALPERKPTPRPDLRMQRIPLGPVVVFGASNFPLAFSVAGGDTAAAFAAGCPVIVKAHRAHLGTSELMARVIQTAADIFDLPKGVFSMLIGSGKDIGDALVRHPLVKAVGFTGSRTGGTALMQAAASRPEPIPVYAEMSSINPVFLLPGALSARSDEMARQFIDSVVLGAGQFCTSPGLAIAVRSPRFDRFISSAKSALRDKAAQTMLTPEIHTSFLHGTQSLAETRGLQLLGHGKEETGPTQGKAALYLTDADTFLSTRLLEQEVFGPLSILVACDRVEEMNVIAEHLSGQLTATLQMSAADLEIAKRLLPILERKAGRIVMNTYPTGVEVSHAMVHGGPFPATSNAQVTSVGTSSIDRFLRPVCYQDFSDDLIPDTLANSNPLGIWRRENGRLFRR